MSTSSLQSVCTGLFGAVVALDQLDVQARREGLPAIARLVAIAQDGTLSVKVGSGQFWLCDFLQTGVAIELTVGDDVLVVAPASGQQRGVVLGRVGRYIPPAVQPIVTIEATESLTLKCGEATIDLRADGQVMIRGEDVLLRAKGTQRIRAAKVAIN